jgi:stringent starvation protein B
MSETSTKPYLIRAIHEWCADNGYRPYIAVVVDEKTVVPMEFVRNGEIVLNVSADATSRLAIGNELIEFEARFNRVARQVSVPIENVSAIYAAENGHGMAFDVARAQPAPTSADAEPGEAPKDEPHDRPRDKAGDKPGNKRDSGDTDAQGKAPAAGLRVVGVGADQSTEVPVRSAGSARPSAPTPRTSAPAPRPALLEAVPTGKRAADAPGSKDGSAGNGDNDNDPSPKAPGRRKPRLTRVK